MHTLPTRLGVSRANRACAQQGWAPPGAQLAHDLPTMPRGRRPAVVSPQGTQATWPPGRCPTTARGSRPWWWLFCGHSILFLQGCCKPQTHPPLLFLDDVSTHPRDAVRKCGHCLGALQPPTPQTAQHRGSDNYLGHGSDPGLRSPAVNHAGCLRVTHRSLSL